ncbi:hypothetical protein RHGRI_000499 [Rhododendron griersonianum]|uniref:Uncharacterized protein n=1 Tax=Rhododendron griersonianum TaxID=479676 RepID=A0AAV6LHS8_9ERIC|nr:hypothetical protein RHGRI_000499 [Rhododendron griersonianum]
MMATETTPVFERSMTATTIEWTTRETNWFVFVLSQDMSRTAWVTRSVVTACWFMRARVEIAWDPHLQADQMVFLSLRWITK